MKVLVILILGFIAYSHAYPQSYSSEDFAANDEALASYYAVDEGVQEQPTNNRVKRQFGVLLGGPAYSSGWGNRYGGYGGGYGNYGGYHHHHHHHHG